MSDPDMSIGSPNDREHAAAFELTRLRSELSAVTSRRDELGKEVNRLAGCRHLATQLEQIINTQAADLEAANAMVDHKSEQYIAARKDADGLRVELSAARAENETLVRGMMEQLKRSATSLSAARARIERLEKALASLNDCISSAWYDGKSNGYTVGVPLEDLRAILAKAEKKERVE